VALGPCLVVSGLLFFEKLYLNLSGMMHFCQYYYYYLIQTRYHAPSVVQQINRLLLGDARCLD
jgi:hypothetical protein